ncbi:autotransporter domain-containing protein [Phaeobacter sp. C3_T13_0]|uniref:autotransporter domain-containing protein n=1 Tax=Phaeobacter cretensis TaxID=3342641 RepID=UPI0039BD4BE0
MKKVMTTTATIFALIVSAGMSIADPLRGEGQHGSYDFGDRYMSTNSDSRQFESDFPLGEVSGGQLTVGLEFGISSLSSNVGTRVASANISANAYDATLSALWVADSRLYIDGRLRYGHFDSQIHTRGGNSADIDGSGYGISVEIGKTFTFPNELTLIPQMQLMYSNIDMGEIAVGGGRLGSLADDDALMARFGLRAERAFSNNSMLYGQIDVYHAFDNDTSVTFGQDKTAMSLGGIVALSDRSQLYVELTSETGMGSASGDSDFGWNIEFEFQF